MRSSKAARTAFCAYLHRRIWGDWAAKRYAEKRGAGTHYRLMVEFEGRRKSEGLA